MGICGDDSMTYYFLSPFFAATTQGEGHTTQHYFLSPFFAVPVASVEPGEATYFLAPFFAVPVKSAETQLPAQVSLLSPMLAYALSIAPSAHGISSATVSPLQVYVSPTTQAVCGSGNLTTTKLLADVVFTTPGVYVGSSVGAKITAPPSVASELLAAPAVGVYNNIVVCCSLAVNSLLATQDVCGFGNVSALLLSADALLLAQAVHGLCDVRVVAVLGNAILVASDVGGYANTITDALVSGWTLIIPEYAQALTALLYVLLLNPEVVINLVQRD